MATGSLGRMLSAAKHLGLPISSRKKTVADACLKALGISVSQFKRKKIFNKIIAEYCERFGLGSTYKGGGVSSRKPASNLPRKSSATKPSDFYASPAWRQLRYFALVKFGSKCCACGATSATGKIMHVDHIKPRARYPELELDPNNVQVLCEDCNIGKGAWDETDWRQPVLRLPGSLCITEGIDRATE